MSFLKSILNCQAVLLVYVHRHRVFLIRKGIYEVLIIIMILVCSRHIKQIDLTVFLITLHDNTLIIENLPQATLKHMILLCDPLLILIKIMAPPSSCATSPLVINRTHPLPLNRRHPQLICSRFQESHLLQISIVSVVARLVVETRRII